MKLTRILILLLLFISMLIVHASDVKAQQIIQLTLDSAADIAINNSYRTQTLEMDIERSMYHLEAERAGLKTQVYANLKTPDLKNISDYKWNSELKLDEIVRQNSNLWQSDFSIKHPLILFGYPTNGYLSLNNTFYRYNQLINGDSEIDYYNRLYLKYEQPLFLPNELKYDLEEAELDLEYIKLNYISNRLGIIDDIVDDYYDIFSIIYFNGIYDNQLDVLQSIYEIASRFASGDSARKIESMQVQLAITNFRENLLSNQSRLREEVSDLKQKLRLDFEDSIIVKPTIQLNPITVDLDEAIKYGFDNSIQMQRLNISKRRTEINVENEKGRNAFHMILEVTYGVEKKDEKYFNLVNQYDNSNSIILNAYIPIWDGGRRKARIQAAQVNIRRRDLEIDDEKQEIRNDIINTYTDLNEYYERSINMSLSVQIAKEVTGIRIAQYGRGEITIQDLLQTVDSYEETEERFINVYLGYRLSLLELMSQTYYDYEKGMSLFDEFELEYKN